LSVFGYVVFVSFIIIINTGLLLLLLLLFLTFYAFVTKLRVVEHDLDRATVSCEKT